MRLFQIAHEFPAEPTNQPHAGPPELGEAAGKTQ